MCTHKRIQNIRWRKQHCMSTDEQCQEKKSWVCCSFVASAWAQERRSMHAVGVAACHVSSDAIPKLSPELLMQSFLCVSKTARQQQAGQRGVGKCHPLQGAQVISRSCLFTHSTLGFRTVDLCGIHCFFIIIKTCTQAKSGNVITLPGWHHLLSVVFIVIAAIWVQVREAGWWPASRTESFIWSLNELLWRHEQNLRSSCHLRLRNRDGRFY